MTTFQTKPFAGMIRFVAFAPPMYPLVEEKTVGGDAAEGAAVQRIVGYEQYQYVKFAPLFVAAMIYC
jgi:hypothetical protein